MNKKKSTIESVSDDMTALLSNGSRVKLSDSKFESGETVIIREDKKAYHKLED